jgi:hypothetical protein
VKDSELRGLLNAAKEGAERAQTMWEADPIIAAQDARDAADCLRDVERELVRRSRKAKADPARLRAAEDVRTRLGLGGAGGVLLFPDEITKPAKAGGARG